MTEQWRELKETIIELRDSDGTATQQEVCKFLVTLMNVLEKQEQEADVLDKIRAEIETSKDCGKAFKLGLDMALEIIDKYKAESEGNNGD